MITETHSHGFKFVPLTDSYDELREAVLRTFPGSGFRRRTFNNVFVLDRDVTRSGSTGYLSDHAHVALL